MSNRHRPGYCNQFRCRLPAVLLVSVLFCWHAESLAAPEANESCLTAGQRQWLSEHPGLRIGVTSIPPQVFRDEKGGDLSGLCIDYIHAVEKHIGYSFAIQYFATWDELMEAGFNGNIDIVYAAQKTPRREEKFLFTRPYLKFENMIITARDVTGPLTLKGLAGKKVAVVRGNSIHEDLARLYPTLNLVPAEDEATGLLLVSFRAADAMVIEPSRAGYIIQDKKITNLHIAGRTEMEFLLGFAVTQEKPQLTEILDAGLAAIQASEKAAIEDRWISISLPRDLRKVWLGLGVCGAAALLVIVWNVLLRRQVERRTAELRDQLQLRTQAEHYRQQVEEQFRHVIEFCPLGVHMYQLENHDRLVLTGANTAAEKMLGIELRSCIGKSILEVFPALAKTDIPDRYRQICKTGIPWQSQFVEYKDEHIQGKYEIYAFQTSAGQIAVMFSEISERIAARLAIEQSEALLSSIFRAAPVGIGVVMDRIFKHVNQHFCNMLGYAAEELLGHSSRMIYPTQEEFEKVGSDKYAQIRQTGIGTIQTQWRRKDGVILNILACSAIIDMNDPSKGTTFTALDITDQIAAQRSLAESQRVLSTLMDNLPGVAYRCQYEPDGLWPVEFISRGCKELTGYDEHDFYTQPGFWQTISSPEDRKATWIQMQQALAQHKKYQIEYRIRTAEGREKWVWEQGSGIYGPHGSVVMIEGLVIDITSRKQASEALQFFQFAVEHAGEAAHWMGPEAKFIYVNDAACRLLGYSRQDMLTMGVRDIDSAYSPENWQRHWAELREKKSLLFEQTHITKEGIRIPVEISANFVEVEGREYNCTFVRDIRLRKQQEQSLKFFQFALEHSGEAAIWTDSDAKFVYVNRAACQILGYTCEELLAMGVADIDKHFLMDGWSETWNRLKQETSLCLESALTTKDGQTIPVEIFGTYVEYEGREYNCTRIHDIRLRRQAEEESRRNTERTEALLRLNQMINAPLSEITDFALEEAVRLTGSKIGYLAFVNDDETVLTMYSWSAAAMAECMMTDKPFHYPVQTTGLWGEAVRQRKPVVTNDYNEPNPLKKGYPEGHVPLVRHMNVPIIVDGKIVLVSGVGNKDSDYDHADILQLTLLMEGMWHLVERHSVAQELANSEKRFREMFEQTSSAVAVYRATEDGQDFIFTDFNPAAERTEKIKKQDVLGRKVTEVFPGVGPFGILDVFRQVWKTGRPVHYPLKLYKDLRVTGWRDNYVYRLPNNEIVALYDDVTDRIVAEQSREKLMKELQAKNEELESIVFVASHDLRSPLVNIQGFAGELGKSCRELTVLLGRENLSEDSARAIRRILDEDIPESLNFISAGTNKMDALAKGLLRLARIGTAAIHIEQMDMNRMMATILKTVQYQMREYGIDIRVGDLPNCMADWVQLGQVFSNLIDNAIKFRNPVRPAVIDIQGSVHGNRVRYTVHDNGIGIAPEHTKKIFEVFHRLNPAGPVKGEGLGLTIVQRILDRLDGTIDVESQPDVGTAFIVELPA